MITAEAVYEQTTREHGRVTAHELGVTYESMQSMGKRKKGGVWYTPEPLAVAIAHQALERALGQAGPTADDLLKLVVCDPCCGTGIFLVAAARRLSREYAQRLYGDDPDDEKAAAVMPFVILSCIFGIDIDPVSAELARLALSLETDGLLPPAALERHVIAGNPLEGDSPPAMDDRTGPAPVPPEDRSNEMTGEH